MRIILGLLMMMHGFAHLAGFFGAWKPRAGIPYKTTVFAGHLNLGDAGMRVFGVVWALAALAFASAGAAALTNQAWWIPMALIAAAASLILTLVETPDARIGALLNVFIVGLVLVGQPRHWF